MSAKAPLSYHKRPSAVEVGQGFSAPYAFLPGKEISPPVTQVGHFS